MIALGLKNEWFSSASIGNLEKMKNVYQILKEKGIEEDIKQWRDCNDYTILMEATCWGRENVLSWLLHELKFDVNEQNSDGGTALNKAAYYNRMECARLLLDAGSQHLKSQWVSSPLDYAKAHRHKEMQRLIESHFQLN